jgi:hypothetical protein
MPAGQTGWDFAKGFDSNLDMIFSRVSKKLLDPDISF